MEGSPSKLTSQKTYPSASAIFLRAETEISPAIRHVTSRPRLRATSVFMPNAIQPNALPSRRPLTVQRAHGLLVVRFATPRRVVSWAVLGGGLRRAHTVGWAQVADSELRPSIDPCELARDRLEAAGITDAVTLMTSRDLSAYVDVDRAYRDVECRC